MSQMQKQVVCLVFFSVAMGFLESAVVVYLREIYYPGGFQFPLSVMQPTVFITELLREIATLIMLAGVGYLAGRSSRQRFAFFLVAFAIWDIFYYVFLKLLLDWPESLLTWDILFLVPVPWAGPVITPCIASVTMILLAAVLYQRDQKSISGGISRVEWSLLGAGSLALLLSWTWDYVARGPLSAEQSITFYSTYAPQHFNWWIFGLGECLLLSAVSILYLRTRGARFIQARPE